MSTFMLKGKPPIKLQDLLRKRKTSLKLFVADTGIVTYQKLQEKCSSLGVSPPTEEEFKSVFSQPVSSPQEGVVVLDPPPLTKDSGQKINVDDFVDHENHQVTVAEPKTYSDNNKSKQKKNKRF